MRRRVLLATAVLVVLAACGLYAWQRDRRDLSCLDGAERSTVSFEFGHPDHTPIRLRFELGAEEAVLRNSRGGDELARRPVWEAKQMVKMLLDPLHDELPADARPPNADLSIAVSCDGGREHVRDLFSRQHMVKLRECVPPIPTSVDAFKEIAWSHSAECARGWWKQPHPWSWGERDDRAVETGYRLWGMVLSLEQQRAGIAEVAR